jgi:hypothetical protein
VASSDSTAAQDRHEASAADAYHAASEAAATEAATAAAAPLDAETRSRLVRAAKGARAQVRPAFMDFSDSEDGSDDSGGLGGHAVPRRSGHDETVLDAMLKGRLGPSTVGVPDGAAGGSAQAKEVESGGVAAAK